MIGERGGICFSFLFSIRTVCCIWFKHPFDEICLCCKYNLFYAVANDLKKLCRICLFPQKCPYLFGQKPAMFLLKRQGLLLRNIAGFWQRGRTFFLEARYFGVMRFSFVKEFEWHVAVNVQYHKKNTNRQSILVHIFFYYIQLVYICIKGGGPGFL